MKPFPPLRNKNPLIFNEITYIYIIQIKFQAKTESVYLIRDSYLRVIIHIYIIQHQHTFCLVQCQLQNMELHTYK